eukprot:358796-Chlamydomonas_euryale.AAC.19
MVCALLLHQNGLLMHRPLPATPTLALNAKVLMPCCVCSYRMPAELPSLGQYCSSSFSNMGTPYLACKHPFRTTVKASRPPGSANRVPCESRCMFAAVKTIMCIMQAVEADLSPSCGRCPEGSIRPNTACGFGAHRRRMVAGVPRAAWTFRGEVSWHLRRVRQVPLALWPRLLRRVCCHTGVNSRTQGHVAR